MGKDVVKKSTRKELSVTIREKQAELLSAEGSWKVRLKDNRNATHKEISKFKLVRTGAVKEANVKRKADLTKASARREGLQEKGKAELDEAIADAKWAYNTIMEASNVEYLEFKRLTDIRFQQISNAEAEKYQPDLEALMAAAADDYAALDAEHDSEIGKIREEIGILEADLEE